MTRATTLRRENEALGTENSHRGYPRFGQLLLQRGMWDGDGGCSRRVGGGGHRPAAADGTYNVRLCFYETPFRPLLTFRFAEDRLLFDMEYNVGFGETKWEELTATAQMGERVER